MKVGEGKGCETVMKYEKRKRGERGKVSNAMAGFRSKYFGGMRSQAKATRFEILLPPSFGLEPDD
jgi:hypothetical protein